MRLGFSVPWAFKMGQFHLQKLILSQNVSTFLTLILGSPIPNYPIERKALRQYMGKRNSPKMEETQGFMYLGYSNWIICRLLS